VLGLWYAGSVGLRRSIPNNKKDGFSPVLSCGAIRYPHRTRCPIKMFYYPITLGMLGSHIQFGDSKN